MIKGARKCICDSDQSHFLVIIIALLLWDVKDNPFILTQTTFLFVLIDNL